MFFTGLILGILAWFIIRCVLTGLYVVEQNERAVKTVFGRARRLGGAMTLEDPEFLNSLSEEERERYNFPVLEVIRPGGPYIKFPWEEVYKVSVATNLVSIAYDPEDSVVNQHNMILEAVTKDQLNINLKGQVRYTVSEKNIYAFLFGASKLAMRSRKMEIK